MADEEISEELLIGGVPEAKVREAIKRLRVEALRLSQPKFSDLVGIQYGTVQKYENTRAVGDAAMLWKFRQLAAERGRADLADIFMSALVGLFGGGAVDLEELPMAVAEELRWVRTLAASSQRPGRELAAVRVYLEWRRHAEPEDVRRIEEDIRARLERLRRIGQAPE